MLFTNLIAYKLTDTDKRFPSASELNDMLSQLRFSPPLPSNSESLGFAPPTAHSDELAVDLGGEGVIMALREDKKRIPASGLKQILAERIEKMEESQGYKVGRKQKKELKEDIELELLPSIIPSTSVTYAIITGNHLLVGASGVKASDAFVGAIFSVIDPLPLEFPLPVDLSDMMTRWLIDDQPDGEFSLGEFALMQGGGGASLQWKNEYADKEVVAEHAAQGKKVTKLGLAMEEGDLGQHTFFTLNATGIIQQVKLSDVNDDDKGEEEEESDEMDRFISDATLTMYVMSSLIKNLEEVCR